MKAGQGSSIKRDFLGARRMMVLVIILLALFSVVALISAVGTYRISIEGSRHLLETRATDVAVNIGFSLERVGLDPDLFPQLVQSDKWEYLAFLALIDMDGTILLHSNQKLIGRTIRDPEILDVIRNERIVTRFKKLATGEEVFVLDFPLKMHLAEKSYAQDEGGKGLLKPLACIKTLVLRVALHPYPARSIERRARFQLAMIGVSLVLLWVLAAFFIKFWRGSYRLQERLAEQERMAALGQMAAVLAHEIRNPLSSIKGFAQLYMEETGDPEMRQDMALIVEQTERLERLTSNLLIYARPTLLHVEEFDLADLCMDFKRMVPIYNRDKIELSLECDSATVSQDREKLLQILLNLFQNAVEALERAEGPGEGRGRVSIKAHLDQDTLVLEVEDNGPGIPADIRQRLFEPFVTSKTKGTGLGLAIVKRLCLAMGGEIRAEDRQEGGTRIVVEVPAHLSDGDEETNGVAMSMAGNR